MQFEAIAEYPASIVLDFSWEHIFKEQEMHMIELFQVAGYSAVKPQVLN